jgi:hypothetical protein
MWGGLLKLEGICLMTTIIIYNELLKYYTHNIVLHITHNGGKHEGPTTIKS